jgi:hypothetical protein
MPVTLDETSDQVLRFLSSNNAGGRSEIQEFCEKIYGIQSGVNSLSSMCQLVLDDFIEKTEDSYHITPAGLEIMKKYGSYSTYRKSYEEKMAAQAALAPAQLKAISNNTVDRKTVAVWTVVLLVIAVIGIIFIAFHHKG